MSKWLNERWKVKRSRQLLMRTDICASADKNYLYTHTHTHTHSHTPVTLLLFSFSLLIVVCGGKTSPKNCVFLYFESRKEEGEGVKRWIIPCSWSRRSKSFLEILFSGENFWLSFLLRSRAGGAECLSCCAFLERIRKLTNDSQNQTCYWLSPQFQNGA